MGRGKEKKVVQVNAKDVDKLLKTKGSKFSKYVEPKKEKEEEESSTGSTIL